MIIKPLGEGVVIRPTEVEEKTKSGLYLAKTASKEKPIFGEVIAIGKVEDVKVGDKVIYSKYAGTEIEDGTDKILIIKLEDILAIIED